MITKTDAETADKYFCEQCDFKCSKKSNYDKHLETRKHKKNYNELQKNDTSLKKYNCICGKGYAHRQGLYTHKKKCDYEKEIATDSMSKLYKKDDIVEVLIKENSDFKNIILDLVKNNGDLQKQML